MLVRICFLYVGQGSSITVLVRDGTTYRVLLVDTNLDQAAGGIDVAAFMKDLLSDGKLYAFVNTHPHDDHLKGLKEVADAITVERVWHTGFDPGKESGNYYEDLEDVVADVKERGGEIVELRGSNSPRQLLEAEVYTLAPAEHVKKDIDKEKDDKAKYARIHEYCGVLRFGKGRAWALVTGDADLDAFKKHITEHHKDRLPAGILDASHHGSRSFFMAEEGDDPYLEGLRAIDPTYVVISAPKKRESRHKHPHDDAVKLYENHVGKGNVLHTGKKRETFFFDIYDDETISEPQSDDGELASTYGLGKNDGESSKAKKSAESKASVRPQTLQVPSTSSALTLWQSARHRQALCWPERPDGTRLHVRARVAGGRGARIGPFQAGAALAPGADLRFEAVFNEQPGDFIFWQVVNTGAEARSRGQLRGSFERGEKSRKEETRYFGDHFIECFVIRHGVCVARSGPFVVRVR